MSVCVDRNGRIVVQGLSQVMAGAPPPSAMWGSWIGSTGTSFTWWPNFNGPTPQYYNVYRQVGAGPIIQIATVITPDSVMGGGGTAQPWFADGTGNATPLTNSTQYTYYVTTYYQGVESAFGPPLTITTLAGLSTLPTLPIAATDPATWIQPYALPNPALGTTWNATNTSNNAATGTGTPGPGNTVNGCGLQYALTNAVLGDTIWATAGATYTATGAGWVVNNYTGSGWVYVVSTGVNSLPAYSTTQADPDYAPYTMSAAPGVNATSATLASNWTLKTGVYPCVFPDDNEKRKVLCTQGSKTLDWSAYNGPNPGISGTLTSTTIGIAFEPGVTPSDIPNMATLSFSFGASGNGVVIPEAGANVRFVGINVKQNPSISNQLFDAVEFQVSGLGNTVTSADSIYFDRCIIGDNDTLSTYSFLRRGMLVNCNRFLCHQCYLWGCIQNLSQGAADSNCFDIAGGGPGCIQNCHLEALAEGIIWGGIYIDPNQLPHDWVYRWNFNCKPQWWTLLPNTDSRQKGQKNHYEIKACQRAQCYGNVHDTCASGTASQGQHGRSIVVGARDQVAGNFVPLGQNCPWVFLSDFDCHDNRCYDVDSGGYFFCGDVSTSAYTARIRIANETIFCNPPEPGDNTFGLWQLGPCTDITIDHVTILVNQNNSNTSSKTCSLYDSAFGAASGSYANPAPFTPNPWPRGADRILIQNCVFDVQGFSGDSLGLGTTALNAALTNYTWRNNVMINDSSTYPSPTSFANGYSNVGFTSLTSTPSTVPLPLSNWNVTTGTYATFSTTGGPVGAIN